MILEGVPAPPGLTEGVFHHAPVAVAVLIGPRLVLQQANHAFALATGGRAEVGRPLGELVPELEEQGYLALMADVVETGRPHVATGARVLLDRRGDGRQEEAFFDFSLEPHRDPHGRVDGVVAISVEVTTQRRSEQLLTGQRALLEQVAQAAPLPEVLDGLVRLIEEQSTDGVLASVLLLDADGRHLRHGAAPSLPCEYNQAIDGIEIGPKVGSCGTAAYRGQPVVVSDVTVDPLWEDYRDLAVRSGLRACWSTPILSGAKVLGTFAMYYAEPRVPSADDLATAALFARTAALAIERSRTDAEREAALARETAARADLRFLLDVNTALSSSLDLYTAAERLSRLAVPTLAPLCVVDVVDEGRIERVAAALAAPDSAAVEQQLMANPPAPDEDHPVARVLRSGRSELADLSGPRLREITTGEQHHRMHAELGTSGYLCIPLTARGRTFGAFTLAARHGVPLEERAISLAEQLASRAALVIDNARQLARNVHVAHELQSGLLPPHLPEVPGMRLAASYRPAGEGLEVGGDFYDVFPIVGDGWAFMVGDVSGRGPRAAVTTALVRSTARAVTPLVGGPAEVLQATNEALLASSGDEEFVTAVYGTLRLQRDGVAVELISAGHPPPLLRRCDGTVEPVAVGGPLLGQLPVTGLQAARVTLQPGEALIVVTDGVLEARDEQGALFGEERLLLALAQADAQAGPAALAAAIDAAVDAHNGAEATDDRAVLVLMAG